MTAQKPSVPEHRVIQLDGTPVDAAVIQSAMYFPDDETGRARCMQFHPFLEPGGDQVWSLDPAKTRNDHPFAQRTRHATTAGAVLACFYLLHRMKDRGGVFAKPSLEKAVHAVEGFAHHAHTFRDGKVIHATRRTLMSNWRTYRAASHLWAAMWLNQEGSAYAFMAPNTQVSDPASIELFLGVAKGLREFGTSTFDARKRPLLDQGTWDVAPHIVARRMPAAAPDSERLAVIMGRYEPRKGEYISARIVK